MANRCDQIVDMRAGSGFSNDSYAQSDASIRLPAGQDSYNYSGEVPAIQEPRHDSDDVNINRLLIDVKQYAKPGVLKDQSKGAVSSVTD